MNILSQGFYTTREAADLIQADSTRRIQSWLDGYPKSNAGPLLCRDYHHEGKRAPHELSFYDLIEVRFVEHFRQHGVKLSTLRAALVVAREKFGPKPFASNKVRFRVGQNKQIYVEDIDSPIASSSEDPKFWNLIKKQYEIVELLHQIIEKGIVFDPVTERAKIWRPRVDEHPDILIDPARAYGKPIVKSGIPTSTLYESWLAEGKDYDLIHEWYEVSPSEIKAAVSFESDLRSARETSAA